MNIKATEFAKKMIKANEPFEKIIEYTELSKETVDKLINELKTKP